MAIDVPPPGQARWNDPQLESARAAILAEAAAEAEEWLDEVDEERRQVLERAAAEGDRLRVQAVEAGRAEVARMQEEADVRIAVEAAVILDAAREQAEEVLRTAELHADQIRRAAEEWAEALRRRAEEEATEIAIQAADDANVVRAEAAALFAVGAGAVPSDPEAPPVAPLRAVEPIRLPVEREPLIGSRARARAERDGHTASAGAAASVTPAGAERAGGATRRRRFLRLFGAR